MAVDQVRLRDWWLILRRELTSGIALGVLLALLALLAACSSDEAPTVATTRNNFV